VDLGVLEDIFLDNRASSLAKSADNLCCIHQEVMPLFNAPDSQYRLDRTRAEAKDEYIQDFLPWLCEKMVRI